MPCIKCSNGKYKYGAGGNCQFDTLTACKAAAAVIHIDQPGHGPHGPNPEPATAPAAPAMNMELDYNSQQMDYGSEDCHPEFLANYKESNV